MIEQGQNVGESIFWVKRTLTLAPVWERLGEFFVDRYLARSSWTRLKGACPYSGTRLFRDARILVLYDESRP
jgi:hypothetical protein